MRIFLSFNSKDTALAEVVRARLPAFEPDIQILRVRLPSEMRDLAPVIIDDLLVRERGNAR